MMWGGLKGKSYFHKVGTEFLPSRLLSLENKTVASFTEGSRLLLLTNRREGQSDLLVPAIFQVALT